MGWIVLLALLEIVKWLVLARALMSWFVAPSSRNPIALFLRRITDPILAPIGELLPRLGAVDLSPLIAFFLLALLQQLVVRIA